MSYRHPAADERNVIHNMYMLGKSLAVVTRCVAGSPAVLPHRPPPSGSRGQRGRTGDRACC